MKKKIFAVALVVVLLVGGLIMASCRIACPGVGSCEVKFVDGAWDTKPEDGYSSCKNSGCAVNNRDGKTKTLECDC